MFERFTDRARGLFRSRGKKLAFTTTTFSVRDISFSDSLSRGKASQRRRARTPADRSKRRGTESRGRSGQPDRRRGVRRLSHRRRRKPSSWRGPRRCRSVTVASAPSTSRSAWRARAKAFRRRCLRSSAPTCRGCAPRSSSSSWPIPVARPRKLARNSQASGPPDSSARFSRLSNDERRTSPRPPRGRDGWRTVAASSGGGSAAGTLAAGRRRHPELRDDGR